MYAIDPERLDLAREFKACIYGRHSGELQRVLNRMRGGVNAGRYVIICTKRHREWVLARMGQRAGDPIEPARPIQELAREVGLSRSALADRFTDLLGQPPMQYLTRWRLQLAAQKLRAGQSSVAKIAEEVGYESEAAFNRAFKREIGAPPAAWRRSGGDRTSSAGVPAG